MLGDTVADPVIARVVEAYDLAYSSIRPMQKGYRNQSFPVLLKNGQMVNLILYKSEEGILQKIKAANAVSNYLAAGSLPVRYQIDPRIIGLRTNAHFRYGALYNYLEGKTIPWEEYTQDHIKVLGKAMSDMHAALAGFSHSSLPEVTDEYLAINQQMKSYFNNASVQRALAQKLLLKPNFVIFDRFEQLLTGCKLLPAKQPLHMDFVRSNILFGEAQPGSTARVAVSGILDFEKASYGHPLFDIARTLAFLLVDCKYKSPEKVRKYFLGSGYIKRGKALLPAAHAQLLEPLLGMFLFYDFYKFLRHNPYESLPENEHFMRTAQLLIPRRLVVPTTSIARLS
ncbi:MAG TPA: phosphotransferase [Candidatus Saccharimonadales bacterium]|nr:phosphotransferase [Candidatus Saccharimonadales bacterium]